MSIPGKQREIESKLVVGRSRGKEEWGVTANGAWNFFLG